MGADPRLPDPLRQYAELHTARTTRRAPLVGEGCGRLLLFFGGILLALALGAGIALLTT